jgi:hypothetical protein
LGISEDRGGCPQPWLNPLGNAPYKALQVFFATSIHNDQQHP